MTPDQVVRALIDAKLPYQQLIKEFDAWTHVSVPNTAGLLPSRQAMIIDKSGTRLWQPHATA
jgi:hypothetical protein